MVAGLQYHSHQGEPKMSSGLDGFFTALKAADAEERTFNILETCCFPKGCRIAEDMQPMLATVLIPKLEAAGMKTDEWTRGALMLEEPFLSQVKAIVCRGCKHFECEHNSTPQSGRRGDILNDITEYTYGERQEANAKLAEALVPQKSVEDWVAKGVVVEMPHVMSSRKQFNLSFAVEHPTKGKTAIIVRRKKGERGDIVMFSSRLGNTTYHPLPNSASETSAKLHEIVTAAI
jgi:hypothetical protein